MHVCQFHSTLPLQLQQRATAAHAAAARRVGVSIRTDPKGSGAVKIATLGDALVSARVVWDLRELTHQRKPRLWRLLAGLYLSFIPWYLPYE